MAQLESRDGIRCDLCLMEHKSKFKYFSYDLCKTIITACAYPSILRANRRDSILSVDMCEACNSAFATKVVEVNKTFRKKHQAVCELTGVSISHGLAYIVFVVSVSVDIEKKDVSSDPHYLSFLISENQKDQFKPKEISPSVNSWKTNSK